MNGMQENNERSSSRKRKINNSNIILILLALIIVVSIGFAYLSTVLNIGGKSAIPAMSWRVHFANAAEEQGSVASTSPIVLQENSTRLSFSTTLNIPLDKYSFTVDVVNDGTIDAMVDDILITGLTSTQSEFFQFKVTYLDGSDIRKYDLLEAGDSIKLLVSLQYLDVDTLIEDTNSGLDLVVDIDYIQANESAVKR